MKEANRWGIVLRAEDMDVRRKLFGMRLVDGGSPDGIVELYIEDDENFFLKASFNYLWLDDLIDVATEMNGMVKK